MTDPNTKFLSIGKDVKIWPLAKIVNAERIAIGNRVIIDDFVLFIGGPESSIGNFVHIASFSSITGGGNLTIEDFAGLSGGVRIYTGNEHYDGRCMTNPTVPPPFREPTRGSISIGRHAIIGANSVILPNIRIGEGAVVGACSLVTKSCEPWSINFGNPARKIGSRPSSQILAHERTLREMYFDEFGEYRSFPNV
jgi:acetyltransferase-like isoleucine patch superfamily enzyme